MFKFKANHHHRTYLRQEFFIINEILKIRGIQWNGTVSQQGGGRLPILFLGLDFIHHSRANTRHVHITPTMFKTLTSLFRHFMNISVVIPMTLHFNLIKDNSFDISLRYQILNSNHILMTCYQEVSLSVLQDEIWMHFLSLSQVSKHISNKQKSNKEFETKEELGREGGH